MQEIEQLAVSITRVFYLATIDLLIVGPSKTHTNGLGQTDGERFFGHQIDLEFTKDFNPLLRCDRNNKDTKQIVKKCLMRSCILSCLSCLHLRK